MPLVRQKQHSAPLARWLPVLVQSGRLLSADGDAGFHARAGVAQSHRETDLKVATSRVCYEGRGFGRNLRTTTMAAVT
jgi:hypothetical protein